MQQNLTEDLKKWLEADPGSRSIEKGALLLLKINRNRCLYDNIIRKGEKAADLLEYHIRKVLQSRLVEVNKAEVAAMMEKVPAIVRAHGLDGAPSPKFASGKRPDHDSLPPEIRQLYVDNDTIRHQMRDTHTRLRLISPANSSCPDSDRYPLVKHLIELDIRYRANWQTYDNWRPGMQADAVPPSVDARTASANAARTCIMLLGKYAKRPDDALAERIRALYAKVDSPTPNLRAKYEAAGL